ncbi:hypothetical protein F5884DRAFT_855532 [Xylogone sp. PMI_703]|nr:hypothetical protein F5884DRAFT_855532 [Xylogone sp. PMI_703]
MWLLSLAGMVHYDDFWDVVAKKVDAYRGDIQDLTETSIRKNTSSGASEWSALEKEATEEVLKQHPLLRKPSQLPENFGDISRLYNTIAPITDRSIISLGFADVLNMFLGSELEAIWGTAWLDGKLNVGDSDTMKKNIARTTAYSRL